MFGNRYVGGEKPDGHVVWDTWKREEVEKHASETKAMDRVVELNQPYVEMNKNAKRYEQ